MIGLALALIGAPLAWYGIHRYRSQGALYARASGTWIKTVATVTESRLIERESTDRDGDSTTWHEPLLHYRYLVGDRAFEGRRAALCSTPRFWQPAPAEAWLSAHSEGAEIGIWYDPEHPGESAPLLDKPSVLSAAAMVFVGAGFVMAGGVMLLGLV